MTELTTTEWQHRRLPALEENRDGADEWFCTVTVGGDEDWLLTISPATYPYVGDDGEVQEGSEMGYLLGEYHALLEGDDLGEVYIADLEAAQAKAVELAREVLFLDE